MTLKGTPKSCAIGSVSMLFRKETQRSEGPQQKKKKKKKKKWCSVADCRTVCVRLDKHLTRKHKIKPGSVPCKVYLREAKSYLAKLELDKASPALATIEDQPSTSYAAPRAIEEPEAKPCNTSSSSESDGICPPSNLESSSVSTSSLSSEGFRPSRTNVMFFEDPRPSRDRQRWLCGFYKYLALPDATDFWWRIRVTRIPW